jgi:O-antigen/teichoic acid export membrane protein
LSTKAKKSSPPLAQRAVHAAWWSAMEIVARYGVQFVVMIVLARLLTPDAFGLIAMLLVFTAVAALLVNAGFGTALVQRQQTTDDEETTVFLFGFAVSVVMAVVLWIAAPAIANFYAQPILVHLTRLQLLVLPLGALAAVPDAILTQRMDFRTRAGAEIVASLCAGLAAVTLAWYGFGVWSLAWQAILALGVRALLLWLLSGWRPRGHFRLAAFRSLFGFGGYMLAANLLDTLSTRLQSLLIGRLFNSQSLGYYSIAQNTQQAPTQFMSGLLNRVGLPVFATVSDQPQKLASALRLSLRVTIFVFVPCMVGIAVVAKPLIVTLYGVPWAPAAPLLSLLSLAAAFWPLHVLNLAAISALGRSDVIVALEVVKVVVSICAVVTGIPFGVVGVAWAVLGSSIFAVTINTWYSHKLLGYGALAQLRDQYPTLLLSACAAAAAWPASHWVQPAPLALAAAIASAVIVYVSGAVFSGVGAWHDLLGLLARLRNSPRPTEHLWGSDT